MTLHLEALRIDHEQVSAPVLDGLDLTIPAGWTAVVGADAAARSAFLGTTAGAAAPAGGRVLGRGHVAHVPARPIPTLQDLAQLADATDRRTRTLRGRLGIGDDWSARPDSLSPGERRRVQLAVALAAEPEVLVLDEPTAHLDDEGRATLLRELGRFHGVGLIVSADRELVDALAVRTLVLDPPGARLRRGPPSSVAAEDRASAQLASAQRVEAERELARLQASRAALREATALAVERRSKRRLGPDDHDAKMRADQARKTGKDAAGARRVRQLERRVADAERRLESEAAVPAAGSVPAPPVLLLRGTFAPDELVLDVGAATLALGPGRSLAVPALIVRAGDRVAIVGRNGAGKSTLLAHVLGHLRRPWAGPDQVGFLPQELCPEAAGEASARAAALDDPDHERLAGLLDGLGAATRSAVHRTGGPLRALMLALRVVATAPTVYLLDEPTDGLEPEAAARLLAALDRTPAAVIVAAADERRLAGFAATRWHVGDGRVTVSGC